MITFAMEISSHIRFVARFTAEQMQEQARADEHSDKMARIRRERHDRESKTRAESAETTRAAIVRLLKEEGHLSGVEVARRMKKDRGAIYKHMRALVEQERIVRKSPTHYEVTR